MTITQTVTIPDSHRLLLDFELPPGIPPGTTARLELSWSPQKEPANSLDAALRKIRELCRDIPISVDNFLEIRRQENEIEENRYRQFFSASKNGN